MRSVCIYLIMHFHPVLVKYTVCWFLWVKLMSLLCSKPACGSFAAHKWSHKLHAIVDRVIESTEVCLSVWQETMQVTHNLTIICLLIYNAGLSNLISLNVWHIWHLTLVPQRPPTLRCSSKPNLEKFSKDEGTTLPLYFSSSQHKEWRHVTLVGMKPSIFRPLRLSIVKSESIDRSSLNWCLSNMCLHNVKL